MFNAISFYYIYEALKGRYLQVVSYAHHFMIYYRCFQND